MTGKAEFMSERPDEHEIGLNFRLRFANGFHQV